MAIMIQKVYCGRRHTKVYCGMSYDQDLIDVNKGGEMNSWTIIAELRKSTE